MARASGGFSCNEIDGWAYLLHIRDEQNLVVRTIADEAIFEKCEHDN